MNAADKEMLASPAVRNYMLFSFAALLSMVPLLLMKGMDLWCIFPLVIGALALMGHWKAGPIFVLLSLAVQVVLRARGINPVVFLQFFIEFLAGGPPPISGGMPIMPATPVLDFLLALCMLAFLAGHYRMQGLVHNIVPLEIRDPSVAGRGKTKKAAAEPFHLRRATRQLPGSELLLLALAGFLSGLAAIGVWRFFRGLRPLVGVDLALVSWRPLLFIWLSALVLLVAWAVFGYLGRTRASREESLLILQDQFWRQTRREQTSLNRWLTWARLWQQRRKEKQS